MDGVAAQQRGTLVEVVVGVLTNNNRAELGSGAGGTLQQNTGQQAADAAKTVEYDVLRGSFNLVLLADDGSQFFLQPGLKITGARSLKLAL